MSNRTIQTKDARPEVGLRLMVALPPLLLLGTILLSGTKSIAQSTETTADPQKYRHTPPTTHTNLYNAEHNGRPGIPQNNPTPPPDHNPPNPKTPRTIGQLLTNPPQTPTPTELETILTELYELLRMPTPTPNQP